MQRGAVVIITEPTRGRYIVQRKDNRHPNPEVRRCLSFWGGHIEEGETPQQAAERELREEILMDLPVAALRFMFSDTVEAQQWPGSWEAHVFELTLAPETFAALQRGLPVEKIGEGLGEPATLEHLVACACSDARLFVASHGELFLRYVHQVSQEMDEPRSVTL